jgi:LacI family transcriptional regulator
MNVHINVHFPINCQIAISFSYTALYLQANFFAWYWLVAFMTKRSTSPTMKEVARTAGVSIQTVSAIVNDKPGITDATRDRVLAAVNTLGYRPYSVARSLRTRKTYTLALVVSDIANPSFATMASAAEKVAQSLGYSLVVFNTHDDTQRESSHIQTAIERWIDGVMFVAAQDSMESLALLESSGIPSVAIDRIPEGYQGTSVTLDNCSAGDIAARHLFNRGHRRFGHISGPLRLRLARERREGFLSTLKELGIAPDQCIVSEGNWECSSGYHAMQQLLADAMRPTAVFSANDRMAIGAISAAEESGLRVPQDISIVGLDDIEVAAYQQPPLTTIRQPFAELATLAIELLLKHVMGEAASNTQIMVSPKLVERQSTTYITD